MPSIEIITHCWSEKHSEFATMLFYQLWSIQECNRVSQSKWRVDSAVVYPETNCAICDLVRAHDRDDSLTVERLTLPIDQFGRRSIGRNIAAKQSTADWVWFCDADYLFRPACFDALFNLQLPDDVVMVFPQQVWISRTHRGGDAVLTCAASSSSSYLKDLWDANWVPEKYNRAIGGAQIVRGDIARKYGYLDGDEKWQRPTMDTLADTKEDVAYRRACQRHGRILGIDLPGVYRLRHSESTIRSHRVTT